MERSEKGKRYITMDKTLNFVLYVDRIPIVQEESVMGAFSGACACLESDFLFSLPYLSKPLERRYVSARDGTADRQEKRTNEIYGSCVAEAAEEVATNQQNRHHLS
jgi:hypothetical protein